MNICNILNIHHFIVLEQNLNFDNIPNRWIMKNKNIANYIALKYPIFVSIDHQGTNFNLSNLELTNLLSGDIFLELSYIKALNLFDNLIVAISIGIFDGLVRLIMIDLRENPIEIIPRDINNNLIYYNIFSSN